MFLNHSINFKKSVVFHHLVNMEFDDFTSILSSDNDDAANEDNYNPEDEKIDVLLEEELNNVDKEEESCSLHEEESFIEIGGPDNIETEEIENIETEEIENIRVENNLDINRNEIPEEITILDPNDKFTLPKLIEKKQRNNQGYIITSILWVLQKYNSLSVQQISAQIGVVKKSIYDPLSIISSLGLVTKTNSSNSEANLNNKLIAPEKIPCPILNLLEIHSEIEKLEQEIEDLKIKIAIEKNRISTHK